MRNTLLLVIGLSLSTAASADSINEGNELSLGAGYGFTLTNRAEGVTNGGLAINADVLFAIPGASGLKLGLQTGYIRIVGGSETSSGGSSIDGSFTQIPILALAKYTFVDHFYGLFGAGVSLRRASLSLNLNLSELGWGSGNLSRSGSDTSAKFGAMAGFGYAIPVGDSLSIDPRLQFFMISAENFYLQAVPTANLTFHF